MPDYPGYPHGQQRQQGSNHLGRGATARETTLRERFPLSRQRLRATTEEGREPLRRWCARGIAQTVVIRVAPAFSLSARLWLTGLARSLAAEPSYRGLGQGSTFNHDMARLDQVSLRQALERCHH